MAKISERASWQILEDVDKIIKNANTIYKRLRPPNFQTLKTRYEEAMAKKKHSNNQKQPNNKQKKHYS